MFPDIEKEAKKELTRKQGSLEFHQWSPELKGQKVIQTPVFFPEKSHGQRSLEGYSPCGCKRVGHDLATKQKQVMQMFLHLTFQLSTRVYTE